MAIEFACPSCNGTLQVGDDAAGRVIRCGGCMTMLRVPGGDAPSSASPSAPASPFESDAPAATPVRRPRRSDTPPEEMPDEPGRRRRRRNPDGDDYDRPPRERGEPPAPGRGVFFWLVGIGAVVFIAILGCCGGMFYMIQEDWQTLQSANGGFKVDLPAKPRANVQKDAKLSLEDGTKAEGTTMVSQQAFVVIYRDIPGTKERAKAGRTDERELQAATDKLLNATAQGAKPLEKPITVGGFPGTELEYTDRAGRNFTAQVIIADTRRYIVLARGPMPHGGDAVRRFLDSFQITDPKLVKEGQEREKDAKKQEEKKKDDDKEDDEEGKKEKKRD